MKRPILFSLLFSVALPAALIPLAPASAQVTTNDDALPEAAPAPKSSKKAPSHPSSAHRTGIRTRNTTDAKPASAAAPTPAAAPIRAPAAQRVGPPPEVPVAPPRPVVIPPPTVDVPTHPPVPPEVVKPDPASKGKTEPYKHGLRILFDPNSSLMNEAMITAVTAEAKKLVAQPHLRVTLWSSASGSVDDLSTPRRIALARALAIRSILIREGVATTRIYPRATGLAPEGTVPPDRLDIIAEGSVSAPSSEAQFGTAPREHAP